MDVEAHALLEEKTPGVYTLGTGVYTLDGDGRWWYWDGSRWVLMGPTTIGWDVKGYGKRISGRTWQEVESG
jgi:hypothetical protein